jgi:class 3 adenylate cyclase
VTETESRPRNRALVASFLFTDLVGYSKGTASEQYAAKETLSEILRRNLAALGKDDYRIKDTGDGALIAFLVNPEHALYMALAIAHDFAHAANAGGLPSSNVRVRTGLHIGAVKEAIDLEARPNFVGDGINAAQRIMDFAGPGQITASRAYFEAVSWLDAAYAALFKHLGASNDKHGRPHELYSVTPNDTVLEKLRLDLGGAARDATETDRTPVSPPDKPAERATAAADASSPAEAKPPAERKWLVPVAALAGLAIVGAIAFVVVPMNRGGAASGSAESKASGATPTTAASPAQSVGKADGATTGSTAATNSPPPAPPSDAKTSVTPAQPASETKSSAIRAQPAADAKGPTSAMSAPEPTPAPASRPAAQRKPAEPPAAVAGSAPTPATVSTSASAPAPASASAPASARCRHILEKVQVGEPLSQDEKRELASSCR